MNFDQQDASEQDWLSGPGSTPEQATQPGFFGGLDITTPIQGAVSGAAEGVSALTGGLSWVAKQVQGQASDIASGIKGDQENPKEEAPWLEKAADWGDRMSADARQAAKDAMPDPRFTGTAANITLGASKVLSEAAMGGGNLKAAAALTGYITGFSRYNDLREQGVDEGTAEKMATVDGIGQGASFFTPMGLPAKWLSEIGPLRQFGTQLATGAIANAAQGVATRYIGSKILSDAGYQQMADQQKPFDAEALEADLLAGGFFGGAHYLAGAREAPEAANRAQEAAENGLPSEVRDSAKATQDAQQVAVERAPGIPVDMKSQAIHQAALSKAVEDLLADRPVDVDADEGKFARGPEDTGRARDILLSAFKDAGVADESAKFDDLNDALEERERPPVKPQARPLEIPDDDGSVAPAEDLLTAAKDEASQVSEEAPSLFKSAADCAGATT